MCHKIKDYLSLSLSLYPCMCIIGLITKFWYDVYDSARLCFAINLKLGWGAKLMKFSGIIEIAIASQPPPRPRPMVKKSFLVYLNAFCSEKSLSQSANHIIEKRFRAAAILFIRKIKVNTHTHTCKLFCSTYSKRGRNQDSKRPC